MIPYCYQYLRRFESKSTFVAPRPYDRRHKPDTQPVMIADSYKRAAAARAIDFVRVGLNYQFH